MSAYPLVSGARKGNAKHLSGASPSLKRGGGRVPTPVVTLRLDPELYGEAKKIGNGNASKGIRYCIRYVASESEEADPRKRAWRVMLLPEDALGRSVAIGIYEGCLRLQSDDSLPGLPLSACNQIVGEHTKKSDKQKRVLPDLEHGGYVEQIDGKYIALIRRKKRVTTYEFREIMQEYKMYIRGEDMYDPLWYGTL